MEEKSQEKRTDVNELGEFGLIDHLTKSFKPEHTSTIKGIGDDAAVLQSEGAYTVVTTDMLLEGIHFDLIYSPLKHLGYKAVVVNLSDVYAMNAVPKQITVSIAISNRFSVEALEELYEGINLACTNYNIDLVGGDTTSSMKGLVISITAIGYTTKEKLVKRDTASPGDVICVTGDLGSAYLGLQILEREKQLFLSDASIKPDLGEEKHLIGKQLKPEARRDMIHEFAKAGLIPTSMIDISDGLASEVLHICKASGTGAYIEEAKLPIHPDAERMALKFNMDPTTAALNGGEDYELLFTVRIEDLEKVRNLPDVFILGDIMPKEHGVKLLTTGGNIHQLIAQGWNHFKPE